MTAGKYKLDITVNCEQSFVSEVSEASEVSEVSEAVWRGVAWRGAVWRGAARCGVACCRVSQKTQTLAESVLLYHCT